MNEPVIRSLSDALLFAVPSVTVLFLSVFHLDTLFTAPRHPAISRRPVCGLDARGEPILTDPDGRPTPRRRRSPASGLLGHAAKTLSI